MTAATSELHFKTIHGFDNLGQGTRRTDAFSHRARVGFDGAPCALGERPVARELHVAGFWTIIFGALGSVGAVFSGIFMTKGSILGHDALRLHHLFVWPAFALLITIATWRLAMGRHLTRPRLAGYLVVMLTVAGLMTAAGYWGGEMMIAR